MKIQISPKKALLVRLPLRIVGSAPYELTLSLPAGTALPEMAAPEGYEIADYDTNKDRASLISLYERCGFDFSEAALDEALAFCLPGGVRLVRHKATGTVAAAMMARHLSSPEFPFGGRVDWLATDPAYRGKGLGRLAAWLATCMLIERGYENIWVTTQPHRPAAIRVFTSLGFRPTTRTLKEYDWPRIDTTVNKDARK